MPATVGNSLPAAGTRQLSGTLRRCVWRRCSALKASCRGDAGNEGRPNVPAARSGAGRRESTDHVTTITDRDHCFHLPGVLTAPAGERSPSWLRIHVCGAVFGVGFSQVPFYERRSGTQTPRQAIRLPTGHRRCRPGQRPGLQLWGTPSNVNASTPCPFPAAAQGKLLPALTHPPGRSAAPGVASTQMPVTG